MEIITKDLVFFIITIISVAFGIYQYFHKPQEDIEKKQIITDKEIDTKATILAQKEAEGKASLLAQQVQWEKEANEKKFCEFGIRLDSALTLAQNHIHTVDVKVDKLIECVNLMSNEITKLSTIINERTMKNNNN